jgi:hypothetical protein
MPSLALKDTGRCVTLHRDAGTSRVQIALAADAWTSGRMQYHVPYMHKP